MKIPRSLLKLYAQRRHLRVYFAAAVGFLIFIQILAFSPSKLEEEAPAPQLKESELLPETEGSVVAATLPKDRVPEYTVEGFKYVSAQAGVKQWRLNAAKAFFYQKDGLAHTKVVNAVIYDEKGNETLVTAKEAKYFFTTQDLELFGDVTTTFPDGMKTVSQYLHYRMKDKTLSIPRSQTLTGHSVETKSREEFEFRSNGLLYQNANQIVRLLDQVEIKATKRIPGREPEITKITADRADIDRRTDVARFFMNENSDSKLRFVVLEQPGMNCRSRRAEIRYGSNDRKLRTARALEEVKIEETPRAPKDYAANPRRRPVSKRYATAGSAEFDSIRNRIILRDFPQVYQDRDTITGEIIIVHRDTNQVEVEQSNAYSDGNEDS